MNLANLIIGAYKENAKRTLFKGVMKNLSEDKTIDKSMREEFKKRS